MIACAQKNKKALAGNKICARMPMCVFKTRVDNVLYYHKHEMEERPRSRLCLKLGQRKLSFQQKLSTASKTQEEPVTQDEPSNSTSTKDEEATSREIPPISGLCNLGNTCYVNSLLQPLRFCPQFSQWIEELHQLSEQVGANPKEHVAKQTDRTRSQSVDTTDRPSVNDGVAEDEAMDCSEPCTEKRGKCMGLATHLHMVMVVTTHMLEFL